MKKQFTLLTFIALIFVNANLFSQDTIAAWTFPPNSSDSLIDISIPANANRFISCEYGTYNTPSHFAFTIDYTTNGAQGSPDKCAKVTGLDNGSDSVAWIIKFKTTGYNNIKLSSKQTAGGNNPGPRDFKVQYKLSGTTTWIDIPNGTIICANDWTTGVLDEIVLPQVCENQSSWVSIRWLQTSNLDINGNLLAPSGISKIDDIIVTGEVISGIDVEIAEPTFSIFPNPSHGDFTIQNDGNIKYVQIYDLSGKNIFEKEGIDDQQFISGLGSGIYFIKLTHDSGLSSTQKLIVQ